MASHLKSALLLGLGTWAATRSVKWGTAYLMSHSSSLGSSGLRAKVIYDSFLNSQRRDVSLGRVALALLYDFTPFTLPFCAEPIFKGRKLDLWIGSFIAVNTLALASLIQVIWAFAIYYPAEALSRYHTIPGSSLARRALPLIEPTFYEDYFKPV